MKASILCRQLLVVFQCNGVVCGNAIDEAIFGIGVVI